MIEAADVRHIANLARLQLEEPELERYAGQMNGILGFFDALAKVDTTDVPMTAHPLPLANAFRADEPRPSLANEALLANAPLAEGPYFRVPKILDAKA